MDSDHRKKMRQRRQKREWAQQRRRREKEYLQQLVQENKELGDYNALLKNEIEEYRNLERQQLMRLCYIRTDSLPTDSYRRKFVGSTSELLVESIVQHRKPSISRLQSKAVAITAPKSSTPSYSMSVTGKGGSSARQMSEGLLGGSTSVAVTPSHSTASSSSQRVSPARYMSESFSSKLATVTVGVYYTTPEGEFDAMFCDGEEADENGDGLGVSSSQGSIDADDTQSSVSSIGGGLVLLQQSINSTSSTASQSPANSIDTSFISVSQSSCVGQDRTYFTAEQPHTGSAQSRLMYTSRLQGNHADHRRISSTRPSPGSRDNCSFIPQPMTNPQNSRSLSLSQQLETSPGFVPLTPLCMKPSRNTAITVTSAIGHKESWTSSADAPEFTMPLETTDDESNNKNGLSVTQSSVRQVGSVSIKPIRERNQTPAETTTTSREHIREKHYTPVPQSLAEAKRNTTPYKPSNESGLRAPIKTETKNQVAAKNMKTVGVVSTKAIHVTTTSPSVHDPDIERLMETYDIGNVDVFDILT